jgi:A/G-specific adenine glycosylase
MILTPSQVSQFQNKVYDYYEMYGRDLPWRDSPTPYQVFVSEVMLQQTQVDRVIPKYKNFIAQFPDFQALATATTQDVLLAWSGLGYNSRGIRLMKAAQAVCDRHEGQLPQEHELLVNLPGIGSATASSIQAYAFNIPSLFIETNIRSIFIHEFFPDEETIHDRLLLPLVEQTLDTKHPAQWYNALMDYGTSLKKLHTNPSRKSTHHAKQKSFEGSDRQIRGKVLKLLLLKPALSMVDLAQKIEVPINRFKSILSKMEKEELIILIDDMVSLHY